MQAQAPEDAKRAKAIELEGWDYPRHLAGRLFSVIVHGDVEGAENVRYSVADWLRYMRLVPAGRLAELDRFIGYWQPYATSHDELDRDEAVQQELRNAARTLLEALRLPAPAAGSAPAIPSRSRVRSDRVQGGNSSSAARRCSAKATIVDSGPAPTSST
jgi:hypothetical protein